MTIKVLFGWRNGRVTQIGIIKHISTSIGPALLNKTAKASCPSELMAKTPVDLQSAYVPIHVAETIF